MNRTKFVFSTLAVAMSAIVTSVANAGPLWEFTTAGNSFTNGTWDFATAFMVGDADLTASGLGYYADPRNGQVDANQVALYKCDNADCTGSGALIASAIVDNTFAIQGHFRYVTITPVVLQAGMSYEVAGVSHSDNYTWNDSGFANDPGISLIQLTTEVARWQTSTTPDFLNFGRNDIPGQDGFWGPNIFVGAATFATPEPATLALIGVGLAGLAGLRRRRSS